MASGSPIVGRETVVDRLVTELTQGDVLLLLGDAGMGKTRVAAEAVSRLRSLGRPVATSTCLPLATPLPLLPVLDLVRSLQRTSGGRLSTALARGPRWVREEVEQALPELRLEVTPPQPIDGWRQERLFAALTRVCRDMAEPAGLTLVVDDLHWSDQASRDFLSYLRRDQHPGVSLLLVARRDQAADDATGAWLLGLGTDPTVVRHRLGPLAREDVGVLARALARTSMTEEAVDELFRRAEGNPFFTEQLVAAGEQDGAAPLPAELAELLQGRAAGLPPAASRILAVLAVAGRPLTEPELGTFVDSPEPLRTGLRDLLRHRLARRAPAGGGFAIEHALVGEAVAGGLLPAERNELDAAIAEVLTARDDPALSSEVADHLAAADRPAEELSARLRAARYAESVHAFTAAAQEWERSSVLIEEGHGDQSQAAAVALAAMICFEAAGDRSRGATVGERGLAQARHHGQRHMAAVLATRLANIHGFADKRRGFAETSAAVDSFEALPPSPEQVDALRQRYYFSLFMGNDGSDRRDLHRAIQLGEQQPAATSELARALIMLGLEQLRTGEFDAGFDALSRARHLVEQQSDPEPRASLAHADALVRLRMNQLEDAADRGMAELLALREQGFGSIFPTTMLIYDVVEALMELGRVAEAGSLVDPLTDRAFQPAAWVLHQARWTVDLARGRLEEAASLLRPRLAVAADLGIGMTSEFSGLRAELALWQGSPASALSVVEITLDEFGEAADAYEAVPLLVLGLRACADLVELASAHRDHDRVDDARRHADGLRAFSGGIAAEPFEHPYVKGLWANWRAEEARCRQEPAATLWEAAAHSWDEIGRPHRAAYARWRQAEQLLNAGERTTATTVLREAWRQADEHVPLRRAIGSLARRARILLEPPTERTDVNEATPAPPPYDLTPRELEVLRLLTRGLTNSQIGATLFLSPKTASVHVSAILRKLGASNRVQAAAIAEHAGLGDEAGAGVRASESRSP